jgi:hypothetical protein
VTREDRIDVLIFVGVFIFLGASFLAASYLAEVFPV